MTDLTKITTPFGLLDKATQDELKDAYEVGFTIEHYSGTLFGWQSKDFDSWYSSVVYRVKPVPVRVEALRWPKSHDGKYLGSYIITSNPDGTDPTVTWEPSE